MRYFASVALEDTVGRCCVLYSDRWATENWRLPGGRIESGESAVMCAERELREEVGVRPVGGLRFLGVIYVKIDDDDWTGYLFHLKTWSGEVRIVEPHKHERLNWLFPYQLKLEGAKTALEAMTLARLTPVQQRILTALARYQDEPRINCEQIAARLDLSWSTFNNECADIYNLIGVRGRYARRNAADWWRARRGAFA